ncbi:MAG UNVERIFIED_CONTAM: hypothetical protein LVR18_13960 [Planctomycetaceae bacterium]
MESEDPPHSSLSDPVAGTVPAALGVAAGGRLELSSKPMESEDPPHSSLSDPVAGTVPATLGVAV